MILVSIKFDVRSIFARAHQMCDIVTNVQSNM